MRTNFEILPMQSKYYLDILFYRQVSLGRGHESLSSFSLVKTFRMIHPHPPTHPQPSPTHIHQTHFQNNATCLFQVTKSIFNHKFKA